MHYQITSDNIEMSASMEALAQQKLQTLENKLKDYDHESIKIRVVLNKAPEEQFLTKIHLRVEGKEFFAEDYGFTLENSLVETINLLERQVEKFKTDFIDDKWREVRKVKRSGDDMKFVDDIELNLNDDLIGSSADEDSASEDSQG